VIIALSESRRQHIPYRNSMMTSVLRDSLGGNCMTTMIANCSVDRANIDVSYTSLTGFADLTSLKIKIAVLTYRVLHGNAPRYLGPLTSTVDVPGRRALRSAGTNRLVVPPVRRVTVGSRAFPVAAAHIWNSLPEHTVSASTLQSFKRHLKTFLLQQSFRLAL